MDKKHQEIKRILFELTDDESQDKEELLDVLNEILRDVKSAIYDVESCD